MRPIEPTRYLINLRSKVVHQLPTLERCNADALRREGYHVTASAEDARDRLARGYRFCRWCTVAGREIAPESGSST